MDNHFLTPPRILPPLDPGFRPAVYYNRRFQQDLAKAGIPMVIGIRRSQTAFTRFETRVFPTNDPHSQANLGYVERLVKFLLWQRGGHTLYIGGPLAIGNHISDIYANVGSRKFDVQICETVFQQPFRVISCPPEEVPPSSEETMALGGYLDGHRIGFDLGASDRKVSAVSNGKVVFSEEVVWEPRKHSDPSYHYEEILGSIRSAAAHLPRIDAVGGSSAGIFIENKPMVASLFRAVPSEKMAEVHNLFLRIRDEIGVPLEVINDGDVTALAGSMSIEDGGVLGVAMGSSEAAGYVDLDGHILGWLNELAFAPVDYSPNAPIDEWSGDRGCGANYFSQQCVFRLAPLADIHIPAELNDAEKLAFVQDKLEAGHLGARRIWETMGVYFGYALAHYADFYEMKHVLVLGRCTSGRGGPLILEKTHQVLEAEFPALAHNLAVQLPDERSRRVGQSIAAASLPQIKTKGGENAIQP